MLQAREQLHIGDQRREETDVFDVLIDAIEIESVAQVLGEIIQAT